ncbi:MAG: ATPase, T2SS/T4P/T4SS family [Acidimicrobiia bacterium]|jgi:pilus assembly protein CpaF
MNDHRHAYDSIRHRALALVEERRVDPASERDQARSLVGAAVEEYQREAHLGRERALHDPERMVDRVLRSLAEYGPLTALLERSDIEEVFIEGSRVTFLEAGGRLRVLDEPTSESENRQVIDRLLAATNRRLDASNPIVQARVLDGTARLTGVIRPVADHLSVTIRRYALRRETLDSLVDLESLTPSAASFLRAAVVAGASILVSGPPGAGKTSMLSALLNAVPATRCVRCCEEVRELHVPLLQGSFYETRPPSLEGTGEIDLRTLVKVVLAMRPDLIVVGEVRGSEAFELTRAVNAGCGFACTVHANSARDALEALVNAALMAGENVPEQVVRKVFAASIDLVVHLDRDASGEGPPRRRVMEVLAVAPSLHDDFTTQPVFARSHLGAALTWVGALPPEGLTSRMERAAGMGLAEICDGRGSPW